MSEEILESARVNLETKKDYFVLLCRGAGDYWYVADMNLDIEVLRSWLHNYGDKVTAYRIVRVRGLPLKEIGIEES